jgi:hypothetical protein
VESGETELFHPLPHLRPPQHHHLLRIRAQRELPPHPHPHSHPDGTPKLPPLLACLPPFVVGTIGLPPYHILRQGDPSWGDACIPKILHKNAYTLRKQKLTQLEENKLEQTHLGAEDPSP